MLISKNKYFNFGFSIVELLVSIAIITVIMGVVAWSYRGSSDRLALTSAAQEMAIVIRQAQVYSLSVKEASVSSGSFQYGYGVYFNPVSSPNDYYLYVDRNANNTYDHTNCIGSGVECVEKFSFRDGVTVTEVCNASTSACHSNGLTSLNVKFLRPNPSALIYFRNPGGSVSNISKGKVVLTSPQGNTITVTVESTGQVLVE